jgi:hypothetical protein
MINSWLEAKQQKERPAIELREVQPTSAPAVKMGAGLFYIIPDKALFDGITNVLKGDTATLQQFL